MTLRKIWFDSYKPIINATWVRARLCKLQKGCTWLAAASDKVYQLLAHGRWFSLGTPASSTTKTGRHHLTEILLKVALSTKNQSINLLTSDHKSNTTKKRIWFKYTSNRNLVELYKPGLSIFFKCTSTSLFTGNKILLIKIWTRKGYDLNILLTSRIYRCPQKYI
jgi:hypothetical protein